MEPELLPDSPTWSFNNSSNIADINSFFIAYCAASKIVLLNAISGKAFALLSSNTQNGKPRKAQKVCLSTSCCAAGFNDGNITVGEIGRLQEIGSYEAGFEISALKGWSDFLVCISEKGKCVQIKDGEAVREGNVGIPQCVISNSKFLIVSSLGIVKINDFTKEVQLNKEALAMDLKEGDDGVYLAIHESRKITGYRNMQVFFEYLLPKPKKKIWQNVCAIQGLSKERCIYANVQGEIYILKTYPQVTSQIFLNNTHNKAIMALLPSETGVVSVGMDRLVINWKIEQVEIEGPALRTSSSPIGYTEPLGILATLEGSVHSMSMDSSGQIYVCSGKLSLLKGIPLSSTIQSRLIGKCDEEMQQISCNPFNSDLIAVLGANQQPKILSIPEEKVINKLELLKICKIAWMDATKIIIASTDQSLFCWEITNQSLKSVVHVGFEITAICYSEEMLWVGTQEGNVLVYLMDGTRIYADVAHVKAITCIAAGAKIAVASEDCKISIHKATCEMMLEKHTRPVLCVAWSPNQPEKLASSSMDHTVQIGDTSTGVPLINIREHQGAVRFVIWHPTCPNTLISGCDDQTIRLWLLDKPYPAQVPPRLPLSKKNETYTKSLFSHLHFYIYQQNREESLESLLELLNPSESVQHKLFSLNYQNALDLLQDAKIHKDQLEFLFWIRSAEREEIIDKNEPIKLDKEWSDLAPLLGENQWREESRKNGEEMLLRRKTHKAVLYFLAARLIKKAIEIYVNANLFMEALILGALHKEDLAEIYRSWAKRLIETSKQEQAAKCYVGIKDYSEALVILESLQYTNPQLSNLIAILKSKLIE